MAERRFAVATKINAFLQAGNFNLAILFHDVSGTGQSPCLPGSLRSKRVQEKRLTFIAKRERNRPPGYFRTQSNKVAVCKGKFLTQTPHEPGHMLLGQCRTE
ncbi:hypothetical protein D3C80_1624180 [compost metagenome]